MRYNLFLYVSCICWFEKDRDAVCQLQFFQELYFTFVTVDEFSVFASAYFRGRWNHFKDIKRRREIVWKKKKFSIGYLSTWLHEPVIQLVY